MGLEEGLNCGLAVDDFASILKGHIQDKYQVRTFGKGCKHNRLIGLDDVLLAS